MGFSQFSAMHRSEIARLSGNDNGSHYRSLARGFCPSLCVLRTHTKRDAQPIDVVGKLGEQSRRLSDANGSVFLSETFGHFLEPTRLGVLKRCDAIAVGQGPVGAGGKKRVEHGLVIRTAVAQHLGFHSDRPVQVVDVIEGSTGRD